MRPLLRLITICAEHGVSEVKKRILDVGDNSNDCHTTGTSTSYVRGKCGPCPRHPGGRTSVVGVAEEYLSGPPSLVSLHLR